MEWVEIGAEGPFEEMGGAELPGLVDPQPELGEDHGLEGAGLEQLDRGMAEDPDPGQEQQPGKYSENNHFALLIVPGLFEPARSASSFGRIVPVRAGRMAGDMRSRVGGPGSAVSGRQSPVGGALAGGRPVAT